MKFCTVVGARPQFIKAASLSAELRKGHTEVLIHTGQHYDYEMSRVFFDELSIPVPDHNLGAGSGLHGAQTGTMLAGIERVLIDERPDAVIVVGDTNSTLAGALAAAKLAIPVAHVEAGLRSFRRTMPEEINRVLTDHVSSWLFCPTPTAVEHLANEGIRKGVFLTGDVLDDTLGNALEVARSTPGILERIGLKGERFALVTLHRAENTDVPGKLAALVRALLESGMRVVFPVHPRTRAALMSQGLWQALEASPDIMLMDSVSYIDCLRLIDSSHVVITDSGGVQREAAALGVPCVVAREETEWVEALQDGRTVLAGSDFTALPVTVRQLLERFGAQERPAAGKRAGAARRIREILESELAL